jgi:hypothetical protein
MEIVAQAESGVSLKNSGLVQAKRKSGYDLVPFVSESENSFTIWFNKSLLNTFPAEITLTGNSPIRPAAVQDCGETIGIILPCRNEKDISLFI